MSRTSTTTRRPSRLARVEADILDEVLATVDDHWFSSPALIALPLFGSC
jgi:hypothetical protein